MFIIAYFNRFIFLYCLKVVALNKQIMRKSLQKIRLFANIENILHKVFRHSSKNLISLILSLSSIISLILSLRSIISYQFLSRSIILSLNSLLAISSSLDRRYSITELSISYQLFSIYQTY